MEEASGTMRAGRCAIAGRPNVGKSTFLNRVLRQKLVIATPRPGTTRSAVLGVYADEQTQIAFVDTPGLARPKSALHRVLVDQAKEGLALADVVLFMVEAPKESAELAPADQLALEMVGKDAPIVLAINKVDRVRDKSALLPLLAHCQEHYDFASVVPISATKDKAFEALLAELRQHLPEGPLFEDEDFLTDRPTRFFASEFIREAVIRRTRQEVPYGCAVVIDRFDEGGKVVRIQASVIVEKASHKGIVIGSRGSRIKEIGIEARQSIERFIERRVHLDLFVKVAEGWTADARKAKALAGGEDV
ncbi:MAG: GTPase Era [Myxococcota bacterium]